MRNTILAALAVLALGATHADAAAFKTLHQFCQVKCTDGDGPWGPPVSDGAGNYYGTADAGGNKNSGGTIWKAAIAGGKWKVTTLYTFCPKESCTDGATPKTSLIIDEAGNLYGATEDGGKNGDGVIFELSPNATGWTYKVLHNFCTEGDCAGDGGQPFALTLAYQGKSSGAKYDGTSPLYGMTAHGGNPGAGTVFSLAPGKKGAWTYSVLHNFCQKTPCVDGGSPISGLTVDGAGNLFGAVEGGKYMAGAVFEMQRAGKSWTYSLLHNFCADQAACADGSSPSGELLLGGDGSLYGTTEFGGVDFGGASAGVVYKLVPNGAKSKFTVLYAFCKTAGCPDGAVPLSGVVFGADGNLYGTATEGGDANDGTLFRLGGKFHTAFTRLVSFGSTTAVGMVPAGQPMLDASGALFGNTLLGGSNNAGTLYKYTP